MYKHSSWLAHIFLLLTTLYLSVPESKAQSRDNIVITGNIDIYSNYIWRGMDMGHRPLIQPGLAASYKDFSLGYAGYYKMAGDGENEANFFYPNEMV